MPLHKLALAEDELAPDALSRSPIIESLLRGLLSSQYPASQWRTAALVSRQFKRVAYSRKFRRRALRLRFERILSVSLLVADQIPHCRCDVFKSTDTICFTVQHRSLENASGCYFEGRCTESGQLLYKIEQPQPVGDEEQCEAQKPQRPAVYVPDADAVMVWIESYICRSFLLTRANEAELLQLVPALNK